MERAVRRLAMILLALLALAPSGAGAAEAWPARPVRLIVPYPPGGSNDIVGRMIAQQLGDRLGKQIDDDNRAGAGSTIDAASELFRIQAKVDMVHVPYKGGAPAMMDVSAGQAQITFSTLIQCLSLVRDGQLKAIGLSATKRSPVLPDVPTIDESGLPGYEANNWWGILAPAGTPRDIVERLHREVNEILGSAETKKRFETEGAEVVRMERGEFARYLAAETERWGKVVKAAGITPE